MNLLHTHPPTLPHCRICGRADLRAFIARELHFGLGDCFLYQQCARCQTIQIVEAPADLGRYYPDGYYSYHVPAPELPGPSRFGRLRDLPGVKRLLLRIAASELVEPDGTPVPRTIGPLRLPSPKRNLRFLSAPWILGTLAPLPFTRRSRVLDVGAGGGVLVHDIAELGVARAVGIDPLIPNDTVLPNGAEVRRAELAQIGGEWDLIMLHHTFEHLANPAETLRLIRQRLAPNGVCLIRMPIVPSYAWQHYGVNWVQLDAPRHLFIHSLTGFAMIAAAAGLRPESVVHDSTDLQFWGSEQYRRGMALTAPVSYALNREKSIFSAKQITRYRRLARHLNRERRGDQVAIYLRHA